MCPGLEICVDWSWSFNLGFPSRVSFKSLVLAIFSFLRASSGTVGCEGELEFRVNGDCRHYKPLFALGDGRDINAPRQNYFDIVINALAEVLANTSILTPDPTDQTDAQIDL
jgi:hypothetical protein